VSVVPKQYNVFRIRSDVKSLIGKSFWLPGSFVYFIQLSCRWRDVVENPVVPP